MNQISGDLNTGLDIIPSLVQDNLVQYSNCENKSAFQTLLQNWTKDAKISRKPDRCVQ